MSDITFAKHSAESGHWYDKDARLVETVPGAKGQPVKPDIRHARKLDLAPGVTGIIRQAAAPGLEKWKREQAILAALTLTRTEGETDREFLARVERDAAEQAQRAAEEGTRIHAAIQAHFQGQPIVPGYEAHVEGVLRCLRNATGTDTGWRSEIAGVHPFGFGTKVDLEGNGWLIDIKGKDGDEAKLLQEETYLEHDMQVVAGMSVVAGGLSLRGGILFVSRTHPGVAVLNGVACQGDYKRAWQCFCSLLQFWQSKNKYRPSWATEIQW